jgi:hypothetical protein
MAEQSMEGCLLEPKRPFQCLWFLVFPIPETSLLTNDKVVDDTGSALRSEPDDSSSIVALPWFTVDYITGELLVSHHGDLV